MRKLSMIIIGFLLLIRVVHSAPGNFDIFGVDTQTKQKIFSCCSKTIQKYIKKNDMFYHSLKQPKEADLIEMKQLEEKIQMQVNQIDNFAIAKLSIIYYPNNKKTFCTLDLVRSVDHQRIPAKPVIHVTRKSEKSNELNQLFRVWNDYNESNLNLIRSNQIDFKNKSCPVTHCTWGFDIQELKETLPKLQDGIRKHKRELIEIIEKSPDDNEREKAIFILANADDDTELLGLLERFVDDPSDLVRNNVMRVLGAIVAKHKVNKLNIHKIIQALNYPYVTDRNKAGYILLGIVKKDTSTHTLVINESGVTLIELLRLKQPNNHDFAYQILRIISGKNYAENDYQRWEEWLKSRQSYFSNHTLT